MHATLASRDVVIDISYLCLLILCSQFIVCLSLLLRVCFLFSSFLFLFWSFLAISVFLFHTDMCGFQSSSSQSLSVRVSKTCETYY